jgi:hypothetical protein
VNVRRLLAVAVFAAAVCAPAAGAAPDPLPFCVADAFGVFEVCVGPPVCGHVLDVTLAC